MDPAQARVAAHQERLERRRQARRTLRDATIVAATAAAGGLGIFAGLAAVNAPGGEAAAATAPVVASAAPAVVNRGDPGRSGLQNRPAQAPVGRQPAVQAPLNQQPVAVTGGSRHR